MLHLWIGILGLFMLPFNYQVRAVIVPACKIRNLSIQPTYGTSLETKRMVNVIQLPPVFVQNIMIGICENSEQPESIGRSGEFFICHQRYSAVEVYTAENSPVDVDPSSSGFENRYLQDIQFTRESVIIESGCDFSLNLLTLFGSRLKADKDVHGPPQQKMFLRSPFQTTPPPYLRQPPMTPGAPYMSSIPPHQGQRSEGFVANSASHQAPTDNFMDHESSGPAPTSAYQDDHHQTISYNAPVTVMHPVPPHMDSISHPGGIPGGGDSHHVFVPVPISHNQGRASSEYEEESSE